MAVTRCIPCDLDPQTKRRFGGAGLKDGEACPICYRPTCRYHLTTVRWRWRATGSADEALICKPCKRSYEHRTWDSHNRDWIT